MPRDPLAAGENQFVRALARRVAALVPTGAIGIGDDCAVLPGRPTRVVSVDALVEGQHFRWDLLTAEDLAIRAIESNLSDLAAMGARAESLWLTLAWPSRAADRRRLAPFMTAVVAHCRRRRVALLGGDTVRASDGATMIALTVIGIPWPGGPVLRSGGTPGDRLCVTGALGGAALGLRLLEGALRPGRSAAARRARRQAIERFRRPRARLAAAPALARCATALIDLSDGLGLDLPRLARASGCGFRVDGERLPVDRSVLRLVPEEEQRLALALAGGDDYELLAAIPPRRVAAARRMLAGQGIALTEIGVLTAPRGGMRWIGAGRPDRPWPEAGWDPFRSLDGRRTGAVGTGASEGPTRR